MVAENLVSDIDSLSFLPILPPSLPPYPNRKDVDLPEHAASPPSPAEDAIGKLIAENLVSDGATLQMGIGSIPNAVLARLTNHRDLGVHTEMFSDGLLPLVRAGNITNAKKKENQGRIVTSFCSGTRALYDFIDDNPLVKFLVSSFEM